MSRKGSDDLRWPDVSDSNFDKSIFSFQFPSNQSDGQKLLIQISINQYFHFENHPKHSQTSKFDHSENSKIFSTHFKLVFNHFTARKKRKLHAKTSLPSRRVSAAKYEGARRGQRGGGRAQN